MWSGSPTCATHWRHPLAPPTGATHWRHPLVPFLAPGWRTTSPRIPAGDRDPRGTTTMLGMCHEGGGVTPAHTTSLSPRSLPPIEEIECRILMGRAAGDSTSHLIGDPPTWTKATTHAEPLSSASR
eukprot:gene7503-biopygen1512